MIGLMVVLLMSFSLMVIVMVMVIVLWGAGRILGIGMDF